MKYTLKTLTYGVALAMLCLTVVAPAAIYGERADNLMYAEGEGISFVANPDGSVTIQFPSRWPLNENKARGTGDAMVGATQAPFVGNYAAAGVLGITFTVTSDGVGHQPLDAYLVLQGNGCTWKGPSFEVAASANGVLTHRTPLDVSAGWRIHDGETVDWAATLADVTSIGIFIAADGPDAQNYTISDFMLVGPDGFSTAIQLTPLGEALMSRFGKSSLDELGALGSGDKDNDGQTDLEELLAGTDENDASSQFAATVVAQDEATTTVEWSSASELLVYRVERCASLASGFSTVAAGLTITSPNVTVAEGTMVWVDQDAPKADGPYFYRVVGDPIAE